MLVGVIERLLYTSSVLFNRLEFIAVWLAIKTVYPWRRWGEKDASNPNEIDAYQERANFNSYLINTGLSIAYGVLGGKIAIWLKHNQTNTAITFGSSLVLLNIMLIGFAYYKYKRGGKDRKVKKTK